MAPVQTPPRYMHDRRDGHGDGGHGDGGDDDSGDSDGGRSEEKVPISGATDGARDAVAYGPGGSKAKVISANGPFAGRESGGGVRGEVYGTSEYGSGYPGLPAGSVAGRGFPFVFWPIVWRSRGYGAPYLYDPEYGTPTNTSRPGGALALATFSAPHANSTLFVIADTSTVASLLTSIQKACTLDTDSSSKVPNPFDESASEPQPEQVVQYYRASSVALVLDGYNHTDALMPQGADGGKTVVVVLPGWVDRTLLDCVNTTIGEAVPLFSGTDSSVYLPSVLGAIGGIVLCFLLLWGCKRSTK